mgnify:CR=1 FL=1
MFKRYRIKVIKNKTTGIASYVPQVRHQIFNWWNINYSNRFYKSYTEMTYLTKPEDAMEFIKAYKITEIKEKVKISYIKIK